MDKLKTSFRIKQIYILPQWKLRRELGSRKASLSFLLPPPPPPHPPPPPDKPTHTHTEKFITDLSKAMLSLLYVLFRPICCLIIVHCDLVGGRENWLFSSSLFYGVSTIRLFLFASPLGGIVSLCSDCGLTILGTSLASLMWRNSCSAR